MAQIPEIVQTALASLKAPVVLTTVDAQGVPNSVYCMLSKTEGDSVVICDNYFVKTRANIKSGSAGAVLFLTPEMKAYQLKGSFDYVTSGALYEEIRDNVDPKHPRVAAVVLHVNEVYCGAEKLV
jgi:predicted pyridoxine 5'-phosphate oxidase superfamily flavin-nucleotide-binding protein